MIDIVEVDAQKHQIVTDKLQQEKIYILQPITEINEKDVRDLIEEAKALIESAGAVVVGVMVQKLRLISPATIFGSGKLIEVAEILKTLTLQFFLTEILLHLRHKTYRSRSGIKK